MSCEHGGQLSIGSVFERDPAGSESSILVSKLDHDLGSNLVIKAMHGFKFMLRAHAVNQKMS